MFMRFVLCLATSVAICGCSSERSTQDLNDQTANESAVARAEARISKIQLGQSKAEVEAQLGPPMMENLSAQGTSCTYMLGMEGMQAQMQAMGSMSSGMGMLGSLQSAAGMAGAMNPMAGAAASGVLGIGSSLFSMGSSVATEANMPKPEDIRMVTIQYVNGPGSIQRVSSIQKMNPGAMGMGPEPTE